MRILVVSCWYAPWEHPRALRWSAIAREWAAGGAEVTVLCAAGAGLASHESSGVRVVRIGRGPAATAPRGGGKPDPGADLARRTWRAVRWPDWACLWYAPARRKALELSAAGQYDRLVSVSDPFTSHLVALAAHRARPQVPWLVDIGDPFSLQERTPVNNPLLYSRLNRCAEGRVLAAAHVVAVTAPAAQERYAAAFPASAAKMAVIPPLYAPPPPGTSGATLFPEDGRLRLLWVGTLYRAVRSPWPLFELFRRLVGGPLGGRVELHLMGNAGDCSDQVDAARREFAGRLVVHGVVPRATALAAARQAACLVNIGNATADQLPSKLAEYAASGRPILNLEGSDADTSRAFLAGYPACLSLPAKEAGTAAGTARIEAFLNQLCSPDQGQIAAWLGPFTAPRVAAAYAALFDAPARTEEA